MDIIGHGVIRKRLSALASADTLPHQAFLFVGAEGVGKSLSAREFSSHLLGMNGNDPEGAQDLMIIRPEVGEQREKLIPVEAVRDAAVFLSRFPADAKRRVVLIEHAELLSEQAQNALLKIFEEPNESSVIILVASRTGSIRDTIRSRAFRVAFPLVPERDLRNGVERFFGDAASSIEPFFFALGRPGIIVSALRDPEAFAKRRDILRHLFRLSSLPFHERLSISETVSSDIREAIMLFEWWETGLRALRKDETDPNRLRRFYSFLGDIETCLQSLRDTNANARLLVDRLLLSV